MRAFRLVLAGIIGLVVGANLARAETKVELKGVHLCCGACVSAVNGILKKIDGVEGKCDQKNKTVSITAPDDATAQKALDALAEGGFHGDTGNKDLTIKAAAAPKGKVKEMTVTGVHNCCRACNTAIKATVKKVDGVTADTAKPRADSFTVSGDFDAAELVKALEAAGFHVKVKE